MTTNETRLLATPISAKTTTAATTNTVSPISSHLDGFGQERTLGVQQRLYKIQLCVCCCCLSQWGGMRVMISNSDERGGCESGKGGEARCGGRTDFVVVAEHIATVEKHHGGINVVVFVVVRHLITNTFQTSELAVYHRRHFSMFSQSHRQKMTPNENSYPLQSY